MTVIRSAGRPAPPGPAARPRTAASVEEMASWAAVAVVGLLALVGLGLWLIGQVAGLAAHRRWPAVPLSAAFGLALRMPAHLADPAAAWPVGVRRQLAGPVLFYAVGVTLLAAVAVLAAVAALRWTAHRRTSAGKAAWDSASWAKAADIRPLLVPAPQPNRVSLGRLGRALVAAEPRRSVMVIAPTQAGKTSRFVVPTVLGWDGPMLITSVKPDVLRLTIAERRRRGPVHIFDPTGSSGFPTTKWSPLLSCTDYDSAERTASWLIEANGDLQLGKGTPFWQTLASKLLAPLLLAAAHDGGGLRQVSRWLDRREQAEVSRILTRRDDPDALDAWASTCAREDKNRDSVYATAEAILKTFASPSARAATDISDADQKAGRVLHVEQLLDANTTLYLVAPAHDQRRLRALFQSLVLAVLRAAQDRHAATGRPLHPALMLMLDEAANIAPLTELATYASTGAGQGIQIVSVWQDLAQVEVLYGRAAATVVNGHTARVLLPGSADLGTLESFSKMIGDHELARRSVSIGADGTRSVSTSGTEVRVAPVEQLRQLPPGSAVVLYGREPAMRLATTGWYEDRAMRAMVGQDAAREADQAAREVDGGSAGAARPQSVAAPGAVPNEPGFPRVPAGAGIGSGLPHLQSLVEVPEQPGQWVDMNTGRLYTLLPALDGTPVRIPVDYTEDETARLDACQRIDWRAELAADQPGATADADQSAHEDSEADGADDPPGQVGRDDGAGEQP